MRRIVTSVLSLALLTSLSACRAKEAFDKVSIAHDLQSRGTTDLMKETANDHYNSPADGRLTDGQVQMYLKVRDHEKAIAQVAKKDMEAHAQKAKEAGEKSLSGMMEGFKTIGSAADVATADIRAAKDLHYNTQEYLWVKGQILAASVSEMTEKMGKAMSATMDASLEQMKKGAAEAKDDATKKMYADMIAGYEKQKAESQAQQAQQSKEEPALAYNRQLLSKYENVLNAYTNEMAKYESKDGEAKKAMDEFQQNVEKAAKPQQ